MYLDVKDKWVSIKSHVTSGIKSLFPIGTAKGSIGIDSVDFKEPDISIETQRNTLVSGKSLTCNVYGTFTKYNPEGRAVEHARMKILDLPVVTHRGTFIVLGKDYAVFNQLRLKPGVYTKKSEDSGEVTTSFNLGKGLGFKLMLSPSDGVFYVRFDKSRASTSMIKIPLYSLLRVLGMSDASMQQSWGEKIFNNNKDKAHLIEDAHKLAIATVYEGKRTGNDVEDLRNYFNGTELNSETTKITLGTAYAKVESGALIAAASKMLKVYSGDKNEDDLDSLLFKEVLAVEDHLMLRIEKGIKETNNVMKIKSSINAGKPLKDCIPTNFLSRLVETFYTKSSLSSPQSEINPIEVLETNHKITAMGEGGIKSEHGIPMSARNLHPSHFGFLDPVRTTESTRVGVDLRTTQSSVVKNREIYSPFDDKRGNKVMLTPVDLAGKVVGFSGQSGKKIVRVLFDGEMKEMPREKVDYWMHDAKDTFTYTSNLTPFMHNDQGNRITMASRFETQAVPLVNRDEPNVQVKSTGGSVEHDIGSRFLSPVAPENGTVTEVTENFVRVNSTRVDIYHVHPLNLKTYLNMTPIVKVGDKVKKGQRLADSNFTKNGTLALGANLNTAYIAYKGWNHEDGIVISDSAAKKLTSQHMYTKEVELSSTVYLDKDRFIQLYPSKVTPSQARKLDGVGVAKKGEIYEKGDPVILALGKKDLTKYDAMLSRIQGALAHPYKDASEYWDHDRPGQVSDVIKTGSNVKVIFTTEDEMRVGDKLCYSDDTEVLTADGWKLFKDTLAEDRICCLNPETSAIVYDTPTELQVWEHSADMYHIKNTALDMLVTPDHQMFVKGRGASVYSLQKARDITGKRVKYKRSGLNISNDVLNFTINGTTYQGDAFLAFMGYYLSEGSSYAGTGGNYIVNLSQSSIANKNTYDKMADTLKLLGLNVLYGKDYIRTNSKSLSEYLKIFGKASEKYIAREYLNVSTRQSRILLGTLMEGDGNWSKSNHGTYTTTSKKLADNMQELALKCEYAGVVKLAAPAGWKVICGKNVYCKEVYKVSICRSKLEPQVNHGHVHQQKVQLEEFVPYSGKVYCCTVPTHVLYVRRNGKPVWSGNSNRHGGKGTVTLILPDKEMPKMSNGKAVDQLLNPAGVISRVNAGQLYETMAGKIAQKTGRPYLAENFSAQDSSKLLTKQLKDNHIKMEEPLFDGKTGKKLGDVFMGSQYTLKLHKMTEGNFAARSTNTYDVNMQPARGGEAGAKAIGLQDVYALLGHNARANLHEMGAYKSQNNAEFWNAIRLGLPVPKAKEPFAFEKFKAIVGASGIDVRKGDNSYSIAPISDKQVFKQSNGKITSSTLLVSGMDKYKSEPGGLFDERITGGMSGKNWSHIDLAEPILNPLFKGVVKVLLHGKDPEAMNPSEVKKELEKINVNKRLAQIKLELAKTKGTSHDKLLKELKYLSALEKMNMKPAEYVLSKFPIIPPQFRPIYDSQSGGAPMVSDVNYLYRDMLNVNNELIALKDFPDTDPTKLKLKKALQQSAGAIIGIEKPTNKKSEKHELQGFMPLLTGSKLEGGGTSKESFFHRKIMKRNQDMTGRGTILPDPDLHIDNVKIPIDMAHELYKPFVLNNLIKHGYSVPKAMEEVRNKSELAMRTLTTEMANRPVLLNRAPTLHKYNILAFKPIAVEGKSIFIPPLVIKGFNADFDGDSVSGDTKVLILENNKVKLMEIKDV